MKQVLQNLSSGITELREIPSPKVRDGHLLIATHVSLISTGTERMLVEFGRSNFLAKAQQQPEKVRMVFDKIKTDGLLPTIETVRNKLDQPIAMGYSNVGRVVEVGRGVSGFSVGDRVVSNGHHAEIVCIPANLCARIPDSVSDREGVFAIVGAIALQGIRLAQPTLGESFVVIGLGLIGLLTVQLLRANGCRVLGVDFDEKKLELARQFGAGTVNLGRGEDPIVAAEAFTEGRGVDGVLLTVANKNSEPVHQAAQMCRKRGRIVLVGVTGLELSRSDFYEKELTFQVSCSYGPGRYDPKYEESGHDYPFGYVRWTEQRNIEAVVNMLAESRLAVGPLISHQLPFAETARAYDIVAGAEPSIGIVLQYPGLDYRGTTVAVKPKNESVSPSEPVLGVIGSGNYASAILIPAFAASGARLKTVTSIKGVSGTNAAQRHGIENSSTDVRSVLGDPEICAAVIATRHDSHANLVCEALRAGKHVFVEKPLVITRQQLDQVETAIAQLIKPRILMVGFNRRFAPQVMKMKQMLSTMLQPKAMVITVNAGAIAAEHWTQDQAAGGGRILGESCHFVDLLRFLAGVPIASMRAIPMRSKLNDTITFSLGFNDGSIGTVHYFANGHRSVAKERIEVFCGGRVLQLDNFRMLTGYGWPAFRKMKLWRQDKGQKQMAATFTNAIRNGDSSPIPLEEILEVARVTLQLHDAQEQQTAAHA